MKCSHYSYENKRSEPRMLAGLHTLLRSSFVVFAGIILSACATIGLEEKDAAPPGKFDWAKVKAVTPKDEPRSRYGNPASYEQDGRTYHVLASADGFTQRGVASWYGTKFHGRRTSSGESYDMFKMTAAHKTLPLPTYARVTNLDNGKQIIVKINDRGPFAKNRIIDLSYAAAHKLEMAQKGTANVQIEAINFKQNTPFVQLEEPEGKVRYVQVGAYSNHKTAQKLAKVLDREIRLPVKITSVRSGGKKLYRVRIGPVPTQPLAQELVSTLSIDELGKPKIVYE
ncbi:septal ring lytic transglycosylase RlpA family protein [Aliikangiella sp. G2MR2-5]|uniref:septal ring lytic transglycosylase RlpA family protein n=1 Tax=Aliikangiella sp. G2MR2-5 TaxID=2788943 RepID=UPI0018AAA2D2|nr:septal ring lytic transglycosylase RlpA family protein [Aliikangiella sp. G2MR2-5]